MEQPTIREVAKLAGVAVGTVSNVLNGSAAVREATREKVETAMRQLGFRPDAIARSLNLRRGRTTAVAAVPGIPRLSSVGYVSVDYTARVNELPRNGERITSLGIKKSLGGPAANVAVMAAGLGGACAVNCELITALGSDAESEWALAELAGRGVRTITVHPYRGGRLSRCLVLVDPAGVRTIVNEPFELGLDGLIQFIGRPSSATERQCLHVEGYQVPNVIDRLDGDRTRHLVASVHATGLPIEWRTMDGFSLLLENFDLVFLNLESARCMTDQGGDADTILADMDAAFRSKARAHRQPILVITMGQDGAFVDALDAEPQMISAPRVGVVDTTGAGDAFVGCFLAAWLNGADPTAAGRLAVIAGSLAVGHEGAQGPRITLNMLTETEPALADVVAAGSHDPAEALTEV